MAKVRKVAAAGGGAGRGQRVGRESAEQRLGKRAFLLSDTRKASKQARQGKGLADQRIVRLSEEEKEHHAPGGPDTARTGAEGEGWERKRGSEGA